MPEYLFVYDYTDSGNREVTRKSEILEADSEEEARDSFDIIFYRNVKLLSVKEYDEKKLLRHLVLQFP